MVETFSSFGAKQPSTLEWHTFPAVSASVAFITLSWSCSSWCHSLILLILGHLIRFLAEWVWISGVVSGGSLLRTWGNTGVEIFKSFGVLPAWSFPASHRVLPMWPLFSKLGSGLVYLKPSCVLTEQFTPNTFPINVVWAASVSTSHSWPLPLCPGC